MSEYQCYEFVALDRALTPEEIDELRSISTRAQISPTGFRNEYRWGDLSADPAKLLGRYFDASLYFSNFGFRRFMLRLPAASINLNRLKPYFPGGAATLSKVGKYVLLDLCNDMEDLEEDWFDGAQFASLVHLRAKLIQGDLSLAYLAWLLAVQCDDVDDSAREPAVPPGLGCLGAPCTALMDFLHLDEDLVAGAAERSGEVEDDPRALRDWVKSLPLEEKDRWLLRAVEEPGLPIGTSLLGKFHRRLPVDRKARRTVSQLRARAEELQSERHDLSS